MTTTETRDWLALSLASGIGLTWFWHLVNRFGSAQAVLQAPGAELKKLPGIRGQHRWLLWHDQVNSEVLPTSS